MIWIALPLFLTLLGVASCGAGLWLLIVRSARRIAAARAGMFRPSLDLADSAVLASLGWVLLIMARIAA